MFLVLLLVVAVYANWGWMFYPRIPNSGCLQTQGLHSLAFEGVGTAFQSYGPISAWGKVVAFFFFF